MFLQPAQQLHDNEGGEKDGVRLGPEVSGNGAALPGGHVWNQEGERRRSADLTHDRGKKRWNKTELCVKITYWAWTALICDRSGSSVYLDGGRDQWDWARPVNRRAISLNCDCVPGMFLSPTTAFPADLLSQRVTLSRSLCLYKKYGSLRARRWILPLFW